MTASSLYPRLIQAFSNPDDPTARLADLRDRDIVVFGPQSSLGLMHLRLLRAAGARIVLLIDDFCREPALDGIPVKTCAAFVAGAARVREAVLVDFTVQDHTRALCRQLAQATGLATCDLLTLLAAFDAPAVYQTVPDMRRLTLARADDWLALARRLADDFSRETLYAILLQRLMFDRSVLRPVNIWGRDEYFGTGAACDTFRLGAAEHFVDCGAHRGTVVQKLLAATDGRYASVHAFEPDHENFGALSWIGVTPLVNFHPHRAAVSDRSEVLRFAQTGTMGSHVSQAGNVEVPALALDDVVEQATFIKMDVEGFEARSLKGARRLLQSKPRLAIASYHYADDLLNIVATLDDLAPGFVLRLRHHFAYYYDTILYASRSDSWLPAPDAS